MVTALLTSLAGCLEICVSEEGNFLTECPVCRRAFEGTQRYCEHCGHRLESASTPGPSEPRQAVARMPTSMAFRSSRYGWLVISVALVGFFFFVKYVPPDGQATLLTSKDRWAAARRPVVVTMAEYERIGTGMSYEQVSTFIGAEGVELSRSYVAGYITVMYSWKNANGSNMNVTFQNGALIAKAQFGLP